jgi:glycerol-3-phosphate acyltransferase PlsY
MITARIISIMIGYIFGLFQTGYLLGKKKHFDLREHGSGNSGATNTVRTLGWKAGAVVFFGDLLKAMLAIFVARLLFADRYPDGVKLLELYAGFGAVLGHNFPCYLHFKGGKGMSCTAGLVIAWYPVMTPVYAVIFLLPVLLTRYVSLGSLIVYATFPIVTYLTMRYGIISVAGGLKAEVIILTVLMAALAFWQHRANIGRLLSGTENRFGAKKAE